MRPRFFFHAQTTDKLLLAAANGRFYTLAADKLPGGRGFGEPVRLMVDIEGEGNIAALLKASPASEAAAGLVRRPRLRHAGGGRDRRDPQGQAGRQSAPRRAAPVVRPIAGGRRLCRGDRREQEDGGLPARRAAGNGPRPGRAAPALSRRRARPTRPASASLRAELGDGRRERPRPAPRPTSPPWRTARGAAGRMPPIGFPRDNRFCGSSVRESGVLPAVGGEGIGGSGWPHERVAVLLRAPEERARRSCRDRAALRS